MKRSIHKIVAVFSVLILCTGVLCGCQLFCTHDWSDATCLSSKTCKVCGKTEGDVADHVWVEADCTHPKTCEICEMTEGSVTDHVWAEADCTHAKTCTVCNMEEGVALGHMWMEADCTHAKTCSVCAETDGDPLGHTLGEASVVVDYIDAVEISKTTCTVCNEVCESKITPLVKLHNGEKFLLNGEEFEYRFNKIIQKISPDCPYKMYHNTEVKETEYGTVYQADEYYQVYNGKIIKKDETLSFYDDYEWRRMRFLVFKAMDFKTYTYDENTQYYGYSSGFGLYVPLSEIPAITFYARDNPYAKELMIAFMLTFLPDMTEEEAWKICQSDLVHNQLRAIPFVYNGVGIEVYHSDLSGYSGEWEDSADFTITLFPLPDDSPYNVEYTIAYPDF